MNFSDYQLERDGVVICEPCLCVTLFSETDLGTLDAPDMLGPYRAFLTRFKNKITYSTLDGDQSRDRRIKPEHFDRLPHELLGFKRRKEGGIVAKFHSGKVAEEAITPIFHHEYRLTGRPHSIVRLSLPLKWLEEQGVAGVEQLLTECLQGFALQSGYAGYCFAYSVYAEYYGIIQSYLGPWLLRHPGLMNPSLSQSLASCHGLPDLGWITLLGSGLVEKIGGSAALEKAVEAIPQAHIQAYPQGVVGIRMGDVPRMGDLQGSDPMDDYRVLGKLLAPLRDGAAIAQRMAVNGLGGQWGRHLADMRPKWINRFFPE